MKLFSADEIRLWDEYTIQHEPISSINLMERAAATCTDWLELNNYTDKAFYVFCGKGNNGGDGLAIARMLRERKTKVVVYILELGSNGSGDFQTILARLQQCHDVTINTIQTEEDFPALPPEGIVIDALFGSGLNRGLDGLSAKLVKYLNEAGCAVISIDIPSGLFTDKSSKGQIAMKARHTLSFQNYKLAFLVAENSDFVGDLHLLDIGLHTGFYTLVSTKYELSDEKLIASIYKPRNCFGHKGNFGHAFIVAGSYGKIGAAVLSAKACLRSGAGLLSCHIPKCGYDIMQTSLPEAMVMTDFHSSFNTKVDTDPANYEAIGIGPGIGTASETRLMLKEILSTCKKPVVLDADALNIIASQKELFKYIPAGSILTPHPKEFARLFGDTNNEFERIELALQMATELNVVVVLKGHHSLIATPDGKAIFNSTGNAGMATAGSGDVLTGILTSLLAQGYKAVDTAVLGVYIHGFAGDIAAKTLSMESMIAGDIIDSLPDAFAYLATL